MPRVVQLRVNLPRGFQNTLLTNNNGTDARYVLARQQMYRIAFLRFTLIYARLFSELLRKMLEFLVLLLALFSFITLIYVHITFVQSSIKCLEAYSNDWDGAKILRVELKDPREGDNYSLYDSYYKEHALRLYEAGLKPCSRKHFLQESEDPEYKNITVGHVEDEKKPLDLEDLLKCKLNDDTEGKTIFQNLAEEFHTMFELNTNEEMHVIEYSLEYGFLRLSPSMRKTLNITILFIVLDPDKDACIGGKFHKFIFDRFLGYDELLLSSVRYLAQKNNFKGFVRNVARELEYIFINDDGWLHSYLMAAIVMPITTFSVSILLRFAHQQIFIACTNVFELLRTRQHQRHFHGSPLLTVVFALCGMMAVICSFFHNSTLTLNITFMVWLADFYDSVCCRATMAKRHFYRFFFLYHFVFYAYYYRFNGLHWQLNLLTSWLFLLHAMLFFFHRYELPYYIQSFEEFRGTHQFRRRNSIRLSRTSTNTQTSSQTTSPSNNEYQAQNLTNELLASSLDQEQQSASNSQIEVDQEGENQDEASRIVRNLDLSQNDFNQPNLETSQVTSVSENSLDDESLPQTLYAEPVNPAQNKECCNTHKNIQLCEFATTQDEGSIETETPSEIENSESTSQHSGFTNRVSEIRQRNVHEHNQMRESLEAGLDSNSNTVIDNNESNNHSLNMTNVDRNNC